MKTYRIATIPGDGIGKEVVPAGREVLEALAAGGERFGFEFEDFGWGGDYFRAHGEMMPADGLDALRGKDAILFGSAGDPHIPDHVTLWGLRLKICQGFDQYANVRPTRSYPDIGCLHDGVDLVIVRENNEGFQPDRNMVAGSGEFRPNDEVTLSVRVITRTGSRRVARAGCRCRGSRCRPRRPPTAGRGAW